MTFKTRKAHIGDADNCTKLLYISGPHLFSYLFLHDAPEICDIFKTIYNMDGTTFSKENALVEVKGKMIRGLVLGFPVSKAGRMEIKLWKCILHNQGIIFYLKYFLRGFCILRYYPKLNKDEFFISNLAVFEEFRGQGIAVKLLKDTQARALEKGLKKLSLFVEIDNAHAKKIYEKFGFIEVDKVLLPKKYHKYNLLGFHKMVKDIIAK